MNSKNIGQMPQSIDKRYRVIKEVAQGFSGEIYQVEEDGHILALKMLRPYAMGLAKEELIATFKFEFNLLKDLKHPNILSIYDFGYDSSLRRFYFTSEWLEGIDLASYCQGLNFEEVEPLLLQTLSGIAYLHAQNILHGDLKSDNLLVVQGTDSPTRSAQVKIIDFGISHPSYAKKGGSPATLSPEKILREDVDARSDLYSLGVIFYTVLSGKNPFFRENHEKTLNSHLSFTPDPILPQVWSQIILKMLQKNPNNRFGSAAEILKELDHQGLIQGFQGPKNVLPARWIGRPDSLKVIYDFLDKLKSLKQKSYLLEISGEKGSGKVKLLKELAYQAELNDISVREQEKAEHHLIIFRDRPLNHYQDKIQTLIKKGYHIAGYIESEGQKISSPDLEIIQHKIRHLNFEEVGKYLSEVTQQKEIPHLLHESIYNHTAGNPSLVIKTVSSLMRDPLLCETSGRWNLSTFYEAAPTLSQLGLTELQVQEISSETKTLDPIEKWESEIDYIEGKIQDLEPKSIINLLSKLRTEIPYPSNHPNRLVCKAKISYIETLLHLKNNQTIEARANIASSLSLLEEANQNGSLFGIKAQNALGQVELKEENNKKAIKIFEQTLKLARQLPVQKRNKVQNNFLGKAYQQDLQIEKAIIHLKEEVRFQEQLENHPTVINIYYNLGDCYLTQKQYEPASQYFNICANRAREARKWNYLLLAYNGLGSVENFSGNTEKALDYYGRAETLAEYLKDYSSAATTSQNRAVIFSDLGSYDEALQEIGRSRNYIRKNQHPGSYEVYLSTRADIETGNIYRLWGKFEESKQFLHQANQNTLEHKSCTSLRFYTLEGLAQLALTQNRVEDFNNIYPQLLESATDAVQKDRTRELAKKSIQIQNKIDHKTNKYSEEEVVKNNTEYTEYNDLLLSISRKLFFEDDEAKLYQRIINFSSEISQSKDNLLLIPQDGKDFNYFQNSGSDLSAELIHFGENLFLKNQTLSDRHFIDTCDQNSNFKNVAGFFLKTKQENLALLLCFQGENSSRLSPKKINLLHNFSDQAGLALWNLKRVNNNKTEKIPYSQKVEQVQIDTKIKPNYSYKIQEIYDEAKLALELSRPLFISGEEGSGKKYFAQKIIEQVKQKGQERQLKLLKLDCSRHSSLIDQQIKNYIQSKSKNSLLHVYNLQNLENQTQVQSLLENAAHNDQNKIIISSRSKNNIDSDLDFIHLSLPGLRFRMEDFNPLVYEINTEASSYYQLEKNVTFENHLLKLMNEYFWPKNISELKNFIFSSVPFASNFIIKSESLPEQLIKKLQATTTETQNTLEFIDNYKNLEINSGLFIHAWSWQKHEKHLFEELLKRYNYEAGEVSHHLQVSIATVYLKIKKYKINAANYEKSPLIKYPNELSLENYKSWLIKQAFREQKQKAYPTAKSLGLNVGTIYKYCQETI